MLLQVVLHRCYLNLRFPSVAQSIAPLLSQLNRIEAEREVQWEQKLVESPAAGTGRLFADHKRVAGSA